MGEKGEGTVRERDAGMLAVWARYIQSWPVLELVKCFYF